MLNIIKWVWRDVLRYKLQTILILLLIVSTSFVYLFIRYASDGLEDEYNQFTNQQQVEQFQFTVNLAASLDQLQQWELLEQKHVDQAEFQQLGFNNIRSKYHLSFQKQDDAQAQQLAEQYRFQYEKMLYKQTQQNNLTYQWIASPGSKHINTLYLTDGKLPTASGEIALPSNASAVLSETAEGYFTYSGRSYKVVGHFIAPNQLIRLSANDSTDPSVSLVLSADDWNRVDEPEQYIYAGRFKDSGQQTDREHAIAEDTKFASFQSITDSATASELIQGVVSNQGLSYIFLFVLSFLCGGIFYIFLGRRLNIERGSWGTLLALGYTPSLIIRIYLLVYGVLCTVSISIGWILAYSGSFLLIEQFKSQYVLPAFPVEAHISSIIIGIISILIIFLLFMLIQLYQFGSKNPLFLFQPDQQPMSKWLTAKCAQWTAKLSFLSRMQSRMSLRSLKIMLLLFTTVCISSLLFMLGISLYFSSSSLIEQKFAGIHYQYNERFDYIKENIGEDTSGQYYELDQKYIQWIDQNQQKQGFQANLLSWDGGTSWLTLLDQKGNSINTALNKGIIVHFSKAQLLGLQIGTSLTVQIDNMTLQYPISGFSYNGDPNTIYMNKSVLTNALHISDSAYNGVFSNQMITASESVKSQSQPSILRVSQAYQQQLVGSSSAQLSAIINQVLGGVIAIIMLLLISLIIIEENRSNIYLFESIGYHPKEIKKLLINVYTPFLIIAYLISIPISSWIVIRILKSVSISTNDFIPFVYNIWIALGIFLIIFVIYQLVIGFSCYSFFKRNRQSKSI